MVRIIVAALLAAPLFVQPAFAAGDTGGSTAKCKSGETYDNATNKCVPNQGRLDDDQIYDLGREFAHAGRYDEAIAVLSQAADKNDPRILNYLGYSHRKLGRVTVGLGYYQDALKADPTYTLVREYMGEAYLQLGDLEAARGQLAAIAKNCGTGCREYAMLSKEIDAYLARKG